MKKLVLLISLLFITACTNSIIVSDNVKKAVINNDGNIVIKKEDITDKATFYQYTIDGVTIELFAVKASDGTIRLAFNTCQVCNPSPRAYFIQEGDYFVCQNCGNRFHIDRIGIEVGGCNPTPITKENQIISDTEIVITSEYVRSYKDKFEPLQIEHNKSK